MTSLFSGIQHIPGVPNTRLAGASGVLVSALKKKKKKKKVVIVGSKVGLTRCLNSRHPARDICFVSFPALCICCLLYSTTFHPAALYCIFPALCASFESIQC